MIEDKESISRWQSDEDGSVFVEYVILVGMFGLVIAGAMIALGKPLMSLYLHTQLVWGGSFP